MRKVSLAIGLLLVAIISLPSLAQETSDGIDEEPSFMLVASAPSGTTDGGTLTLEGVPTVIYFSDRPARIAGHISIEALVESWTQGDDPLQADPPNAVLSILASGDDLVIELLSAELEGDALRFEFLVIEGSLPDGSFGPASLFIDPIRNSGPWTGT